jgi:hypothetical protein
MPEAIDVDAELATLRAQRKAREANAGERSLEGIRPEDAPPPLPTLRTIWAEDLERQPIEPRKWIVDDIVPAGCVSGFYGPGAVGKDTILMQFAAAGMSGRNGSASTSKLASSFM